MSYVRTTHLPGDDRYFAHLDAFLAARVPVLSAADWRAQRLRALHREERCDAPGGPGPGNRVAGLLDLIAEVESCGFKVEGSTFNLEPSTLNVQPATFNLRVLEIGSYRGVSSEAFALTCAALTCVDPWDDQAAFTAFRARMAGYPHVRTVRGRSPDALTAMPAASFDLVYIDAIHAAAELAADIRAAWRVVRPGGWIAGHDFGGPLGEVTDTVRRLLGEPRVFADSSWLVRRPETLRVEG